MRLEAGGGAVLSDHAGRATDGAGGGVQVTGVQRLRDVFLEARCVQEHGTQASLRSGQATLARIEDAFGEPGDSGLSSQLTAVLVRLGRCRQRARPTPPPAPSCWSAPARSPRASGGSTPRWSDQWSAARAQLTGTVAEVNSAATGVAVLNRAITNASAAGLAPNDLTDQRDVLVQRLASLAGVSVRAGEGGAVDVYLQGGALVRGGEASALAVSGAATMTQPAGQVSLTWAADGRAAPGAGGQAGGLLTALDDTLPRYRAALDSVAVALRDSVNTVHAQGFDARGLAGGPVFLGTGAADLTVAVSDASGFAAAGSAGSRDGSVAVRLAELGTAAGGPDALHRGVVVRLGVEAQTATRRVEIQTAIANQVDADRDADSGVNLDEEMANLIAFQHAYEGAARYLTAVDQMLDTLINRTGLVGR